LAEEKESKGRWWAGSVFLDYLMTYKCKAKFDQ